MSSETSPNQSEYRVLARKYRPQNFDELIGQDALVRTLTNAIESGRVAHAFMLTGVRGVGKTTTARIIAKALNYSKGPTTGPTDDCSICQAISADRHPDVIEMDAASRTGVDDIREILDGVRYAPSEARYKVYVIDEVHMLSKNAFNALLKTLEEPPPHVKFIFATTEIRKVPVTVLSRCQRFDLRRVDVPTLAAHFTKICELEKVRAEDEAIALIARAADGSVRDGLSLLDQAMALSAEKITAQSVKDMIGLADRARSLDIIERVLSGNTAEALGILDDIYKQGGDPLVLMQDLLDVTHTLTKFKAMPGAADTHQAMASDQIARASLLASELSMPTLGKAWQILLKGISEVQYAPNPQSAAEMVIIRLAYAADLPDPADLIKRLEEGGAASYTAAPVMAGRGGGGETVMRSSGNAAPALMPEPQGDVVKAIHTLEDVMAVLEQGQEFLLAQQVYQFVHLVKLQEGRIEFRPHEQAPTKLAQELGARLSKLAGQRWVVSVSSAAGAPTLAEAKENVRVEEFNKVLQMPIVREFLEVFPDAKLVDISD